MGPEVNEAARESYMNRGFGPLILLMLQRTGTLGLPGLINLLSWTRAYSRRKRKFLDISVPTLAKWKKDIEAKSTPAGAQKLGEFQIPSVGYPLATVIVTTFRSEQYLESFVSNLLEQTAIEKCEVLIVMSAPAKEEISILERRLGQSPFVRLIEVAEKVTIYEAWNIATRQSSGPYITNMNVDDLRHPQSLEIQIADAYRTKSDVIWQDFYLSLDHKANWETIKNIGLRSNLAPVSQSSLARGVNAPHNAPMWSRQLHTKIGFFDESFLSGADHDFWLRAAVSGARFHKSDQAHVAYFLNPEGMSTKTDSPSRIEGLRILHKYRRYA